MDKPLCGAVGKVIEEDKPISDVWDVIVAAIGVSVLINLLKLIPDFGKAKSFGELIKSLLGFEATPIAVGILTAVIIAAVFFMNWFYKCVSEPDGEERCLTGAVDAIYSKDPGFFAFATEHPSIDVVVRPCYWDFISLKAAYIDCDEEKKSPRLKAVFKSGAVCAAAFGGFIGAVVGGTIGVAVAAMAAAAIGCVVIIICLLVMLLVIAIVAACAIIGATMGSLMAYGIGRVTDDIDLDYMVFTGQLVKVVGPTAANMNYEGAVVQIFSKSDELAVLGRIEEMPHYDSDQVDAHFANVDDPCPHCRDTIK